MSIQNDIHAIRELLFEARDREKLERILIELERLVNEVSILQAENKTLVEALTRIADPLFGLRMGNMDIDFLQKEAHAALGKGMNCLTHGPFPGEGACPVCSGIEEPTTLNKTSTLVDLLAEMKARAEAATPGPWFSQSPDTRYGYQKWEDEGWTVSPQLGSPGWETDGGCEGYGISKVNAEFIAHARTDMPRLIAALEKAIEQRDYFCSKLMNHELQMDKITKHIPQGFNDELQAILAGEKK